MYGSQPCDPGSNPGWRTILHSAGLDGRVVYGARLKFEYSKECVGSNPTRGTSFGARGGFRLADPRIPGPDGTHHSVLVA